MECGNVGQEKLVSKGGAEPDTKQTVVQRKGKSSSVVRESLGSGQGRWVHSIRNKVYPAVSPLGCVLSSSCVRRLPTEVA
jgi:hypothetical protein